MSFPNNSTTEEAVKTLEKRSTPIATLERILTASRTGMTPMMTKRYLLRRILWSRELGSGESGISVFFWRLLQLSVYFRLFTG